MQVRWIIQGELELHSLESCIRTGSDRKLSGYKIRRIPMESHFADESSYAADELENFADSNQKNLFLNHFRKSSLRQTFLISTSRATCAARPEKALNRSENLDKPHKGDPLSVRSISSGTRI